MNLAELSIEDGRELCLRLIQFINFSRNLAYRQEYQPAWFSFSGFLYFEIVRYPSQSQHFHKQVCLFHGSDSIKNAFQTWLADLFIISIIIRLTSFNLNSNRF